MAIRQQTQSARRNVRKAQSTARATKSISSTPARSRSVSGRQGGAVAQRRQTGANSPKTRTELYEIAKRKDLPGRSKMGRAELARKLGEK